MRVEEKSYPIPGLGEWDNGQHRTLLLHSIRMMSCNGQEWNWEKKWMLADHSVVGNHILRGQHFKSSYTSMTWIFQCGTWWSSTVSKSVALWAIVVASGEVERLKTEHVLCSRPLTWQTAPEVRVVVLRKGIRIFISPWEVYSLFFQGI